MRLIIERRIDSSFYALSLPWPHIYSGLLCHVTVPFFRVPPSYHVTSVMGQLFILLEDHLGVLAYLLSTNTIASWAPEHSWRSGHILLLPIHWASGLNAPFYLSLRS